jgi:thioredoxin-dependent peroxiredoxin
MRLILSLAVAYILAVPASAALRPGALAPAFETKAAMAGKPFTFSMAAARKKGPVVLYFFPAAFTPGCTVEANEFAQAMPEFRKLGASVIGAAGDDIEKLTKFSVEECRSKFPVGVATPAISKAYDVAIPLAGRTNRTSYLIAPNGQIIHVHSNGDYRGHVQIMLKALKDWRAQQPKKR